MMLSATVHDILYYMSPIYCQTIIDSVNTLSLSLSHIFFLFADSCNLVFAVIFFMMVEK